MASLAPSTGAQGTKDNVGSGGGAFAEGGAGAGSAALARSDSAGSGSSSSSSSNSGTASPTAVEQLVMTEFTRLVADPDIAIQVAAIRALTHVIRCTKEKTAQGLLIELREAADFLKACDRSLLRDKTPISVTAGCELLVRHVTRTSKFDHKDYDAFKKALEVRGEQFGAVAHRSRQRAATVGHTFIRDGAVVLVHGHSRTVVQLLLRAAKTKHFSVIVTEGRPDNAGFKTCKALEKSGVPTTLVLDSAMGYMLERVDMVLVGAEGVVENGGVINKIGTYQLAVVAAATSTPVYVAAECYKFARLFPLNQRDVPETLGAQQPLQSPMPKQDYASLMAVENPLCDYTPPKYITLLFTDLGILTPSAISDELIKLYS